MNIVIFEDGKSGRGSRAKLIRRGNKRVLIEFLKHDYSTGKDVLVTEWFKLYIPSYALGHKKKFKHNNKRKFASYCHCESNEFYSDRAQSEEFKAEFKEYCPSEYESLYGDL